MSPRIRSIRLSACLLFLTVAGSAGAAPLSLALKPASVSVTGMTAGGSAVVFGVTREVDEDDYTTMTAATCATTRQPAR